MNLLIVSATAHFRNGNQVVGWGPAVEEIDHLAGLFSRIVHVAPLHAGKPAAVMSPYTNGRVRFVPVRPAGGPGWLGKLDVLLHTPGYIRTILAHLDQADAIHVRCPSNIGLLAIVLLAFVHKPAVRWIKYAGEWLPQAPEEVSYRLQRWWLRRGFSRAYVTVNGAWPGQPGHVRTFHNPSLTGGRLRRASRRSAGKGLGVPLRLLFAGRLSKSKGAARAVEVLARLHDAGLAVELDLAGDGPDRPRIERLAREFKVASALRIHGWLGRSALDRLYERSHFLVLPSESEGWPKVLSEAMAHGVVPLASGVGGIPQVLAECRTGACFGHEDIQGFADAAIRYHADPDRWRRESLLAMRAAQRFTYERYLTTLSRMLGRESPPGVLASAREMAAAVAARPPHESIELQTKSHAR